MTKKKDKVIFRADITDFDHGIDGIDYSSTLGFVKSIVEKDVKTREAGEQALYDKLTGSEVKDIPENEAIVSSGVSVWANSCITRARQIYEMPNGRKVTARHVVPPVTVAETEDTTEIIVNEEIGKVFIAEKTVSKCEEPENTPRYAITGSQVAAERAAKSILKYVVGNIRERFKTIAANDSELLINTAIELKRKIDELVSEYT